MALSNMSALAETMRAVVWQGQPFNISVLDVPKPTIQNSTDVIVRMSRAAICGSDLHIYRGTMEHQVLPVGVGHEGVGYIAEVGFEVSLLNVGDAVIVPFTNPDGHLETALTPVPYAAFGNGGTLGGTQAEYLRVPHAEEGLIPISAVNYTDPTTNETTSLLNDYVMLSDIFATGWTALDFAGFQPGDTVAIFGAGPVGLMAAYSATLRGASRVYSVDYVPERLRLAASIGAIPINFQTADPVDQILAREPRGVTRSVDCVGFEQVNRNLTVQSDVILQNMLAVTAVNGGMGTVGVYSHGGHDTASQPRASTIHTDFNLSLADFWSRGFHWGAGISRPLDLAPQLLHLVASGKARPGFIVSDVVDIEDAPAAYARFNNHSATKVVIAFDH
ncbi:zinc-binding dehydrogenase family oxidoreductase [Aspergillus japonicus CBS 114.51]|uniref:Zinc-binding dehydrogenase family oxidoreductase n=1 Tax=Aspergillus japonicus CBS 114.51 TaxID=1448312 RepID=A0A8T8WWA8_ASPJA|nr:zinc-binding dehydrogenase family oxidoreductase [Aspergillus japonicus CBS 114.51]RAH80137.1 zinc-binding dehydrogenase family oxidoreductase [Aspergillus japonicus CBS 114.51]